MKKSIKARFSQSIWLLIIFALLCFLPACGGSLGEDTGSNTDTTITPASLDLVASPPTVKSDGTTLSTITVTAKNSSNAALSGVAIDMSANTGNLAAGTSGTVTTGAGGTATATFSSGGNPINRTATITATAGSVSSVIPIDIVGSTITMSPSATSLTTAGTDSITLTITAKNSAGDGVSGAAVTLTQSGTGTVNIASASGTANSSGVFTTTVTGATAGSVTITARALGASTSTDLTVATAVETFAIDYQELNGAEVTGNPDPTSMVDGDNLAIRVNVPSAYSSHNIVFVSTIGTWASSGPPPTFTITVAPSGGKATATLNTTSVGTATVQAYIEGHESIQDTLTVYMLSANPANSIILQATPTVVPVKTTSTTVTSTITATVRDSSDPAVPVANVPVAFSIVNPTGGGETISPVVVMTGTDGTASTIFTPGTLPSYDAGGVKIHAAVVGTTVETGVPPSGIDTSVVIGGTGGSVAFGIATALGSTGGDPATQYIQNMSVLVADINGNPVPGALVSLSVKPIAFSTGLGCSYDPDGERCYIGPPVVCVPGNYGTYLNEDINENLILDPGEDGRRYYYADPTTDVGPGTIDGSLTPPNSAVAIVGTNTSTTSITGANGVANFSLVYPKNSAIWTVVRVRASTTVQGSETVAQVIFRLSALQADVEPCKLVNFYSY